MQTRFIALLALITCAPICLAADLAGDRNANERPALTPEQITRGQAIQQLLVRGIDFARERGDWPKDLAELKGEKLPVVYVGPPAKLDTSDRNVRSRLRAISPVCHETFEKFPDGVWVGYADGHIEIVRSAPDLQTALAQFKAAGALIIKADAAASIDRPAQEVDARLMLRITDEDNKPVVGAHAGQFLWNADYELRGRRGGMMIRSGDSEGAAEAPSDANGQIELLYTWFFAPENTSGRSLSLVVYHKQRALMAIVALPPTLFVPRSEVKTPRLDVKLHRTSSVEGSLSRVASPLMGKEQKFTEVDVHVLGSTPLRALASMSMNRQFHFLLPPGDYLLHAYGESSFNTDRYVHIDAGTPTIKLEIDLPADSLTSLVGKPAPEIRGIKGWQNGNETTLEKLRGKWVLVDFWGHWCPSCIAAMPDMMKLHDDFGERGLAIVAVHDDSVESIAEMQQHLTATKAQLWKGRELPFFVALDGGGELPIAGTDRSVKGATHAAYGVQSWPTTVLVDPEGKVIGEVDVQGPDLRKLLEEKLPTKK